MRLACIAILLLAACCPSSGQGYPRLDSPAAPSQIDTAARRADTTASVSGIDTVVTYSSADSIVYSLSTKTMSLYRKGIIRYEQMELKSDRINIDWTTATMTATGVVDTSDTSGEKKRGMPIMKDGGEEYHGRELGYNFRTKKGRIDIADTRIDQGYYHGEKIKKVGQEILFVENGRYTTCDADEPHYYFGSPKMKVIPGDKVIAEPIYLYISGVPLFWLPVGVFPSKGGRRSGLIPPAIAEDATHGRLLRHLGYYWAISDYLDVNLKTDLYTKGSWAASSDLHYALRYNFTGSVSGLYRKIIEGESSDPGRRVDESYSLSLNHRQEIDPTTRFDVNFTFASNNSFQNTIDLNQALRQDITSNATLTKSWEGTPNSIGISLTRRQNLIDGSLYEVLPSFSFNHSQSFPFRFGRSSSEYADLAWYEMIGVSYGLNLSNSRNKIHLSVSGIRDTINGVDSVRTVEDFRFDRSQTLSQTVSLNIAPKVGYFTIAPSLVYQDQRSFTDNDVPDRSPLDSSFYIRKDRQSSRSGFVSAGISASTKLYGILQPGILGIAALRHTLTPNLSFSYSKQVVGEILAPKQMVMSLSLGNVLESKGTESEEGKEPTKLTLLNVGTGVSYNFSADSLNFSPIGVNFRTSLGNILDVGGGAGFDVYKLDEPRPGFFNRVNKFLISEEGALARMTNFNINLSTSIAGDRKTTKRETPDSAAVVERRSSGIYGIFQEEEPDFSIPWRLSASWDYGENKVPGQRSRSSSVRGNMEFNLTENWKVSVNGGYDIANNQVVVPNINISRDLHCWFMNFSWVPIGAYRHYQFEIRLKAPQLQDVKVTKQGSDRGIY